MPTIWVRDRSSVISPTDLAHQPPPDSRLLDTQSDAPDHRGFDYRRFPTEEVQ